MPADWDLLEEVYAFARERQVQRVDKAVKKRLERTLIDRETSRLRSLQWYYAEAKNTGTNSAIAAAIDVFRKAAMQDQGHPDYDPLWTIPAK